MCTPSVKARDKALPLVETGGFDWNRLLTVSAGHYELGPYDIRGPQVRPTATVAIFEVGPLLADPPINVPSVLAICGRIQLQSPVGVTTHLHGARVQASSDGWPLEPAGFEANPYGFHTVREFTYPNAQRATIVPPALETSPPCPSVAAAAAAQGN